MLKEGAVYTGNAPQAFAGLSPEWSLSPPGSWALINPERPCLLVITRGGPGVFQDEFQMLTPKRKHPRSVSAPDSLFLEVISQRCQFPRPSWNAWLFHSGLRRPLFHPPTPFWPSPKSCVGVHLGSLLLLAFSLPMSKLVNDLLLVGSPDLQPVISMCGIQHFQQIM